MNFFNLPMLELNDSAEVEFILKELAENFERAEQKVSEIQDVLNITPVASLNQLRYAGYHLCRVLDKSQLYSTPIKLEHSHILSAYKHCLRAYYDALDHTASLVIKMFSDVENRYNDLFIPISEYFPEYNTWKKELTTLGRLRKLKEENELYEYAKTQNKREDYYKILDSKIDSVLNVYDHIPVMNEKLSILSKEKLIEMKKEKKKKEVQERKFKDTASMININLFILIIATISLIVSIFK